MIERERRDPKRERPRPREDSRSIDPSDCGPPRQAPDFALPLESARLAHALRCCPVEVRERVRETNVIFNPSVGSGGYGDRAKATVLHIQESELTMNEPV